MATIFPETYETSNYPMTFGYNNKTIVEEKTKPHQQKVSLVRRIEFTSNFFFYISLPCSPKTF